MPEILHDFILDTLNNREIFASPDKSAAPSTNHESYEVEVKKSAKRKSWSLHVYPGGRVQLSVPTRYTEKHIQEILYKHREWILKKRKRMLNAAPTRLTQKWVDGEKIFYAGVEHVLRVQTSSFPNIRIENNELICALPNKQMHWVKKMVEDFFLEKTEILIRPLLDKWVSRMQIKSPPPLSFRKLNRSWGLCKSDGRITLHWHLSRLHPDFAEYVLVHELCHLFHMNHGPKFKALLTEHIPNWKIIKKTHESVSH